MCKTECLSKSAKALTIPALPCTTSLHESMAIEQLRYILEHMQTQPPYRDQNNRLSHRFENACTWILSAPVEVTVLSP